MDAVEEPTMFVTFFDFHLIVHREWVPRGQTVDQFFFRKSRKDYVKKLGKKG